MKTKITKQHKIKSAPNNIPMAALTDIVHDNLYTANAVPYQFFHVDFDFVREFNYTIKQEDGPTITNTDGYNSYLIVVDRAT